jgi:hypothetical protein
MEAVVNEPGGTAWSSRLEEARLAGKTGTAQVVKLKDDSDRGKEALYQHRDHAPSSPTRRPTTRNWPWRWWWNTAARQRRAGRPGISPAISGWNRNRRLRMLLGGGLSTRFRDPAASGDGEDV